MVPDGHAIAFVSSRGNQGLTFGVWLVDPDGSNLRIVANPGLGPAWSPDGRWVYYSTRGGAAATAIVLKKVPVDGGPAVTVTTERLRNVIGLDGTTLYYSSTGRSSTARRNSKISPTTAITVRSAPTWLERRQPLGQDLALDPEDLGLAGADGHHDEHRARVSSVVRAKQKSRGPTSASLARHDVPPV